MGAKYDNKTGYSIPRSFKPAVYQSITTVIVSDALMLFTLLLIIGLRNALGVDAQLIGLAIVLFGFKAIFTGYGLYGLLRGWLGVTYFVQNNQLYIQSEIRQMPSTIYKIKDIAKAVVDDSYRGIKKQDYGTIIITFNKNASSDTIKLSGVKNPELIARNLSGNQ